MKKGKIILSAAAFIVTAGSVLAFKAHSRFSPTGHVVYGLTSTGGACVVSTCRTNPSGRGDKITCRTSSGTTLVTNGAGEFYKSFNNSLQKCTAPTLHFTTGAN
jgi:hypothetical protein